MYVDSHENQWIIKGMQVFFCTFWFNLKENALK